MNRNPRKGDLMCWAGIHETVVIAPRSHFHACGPRLAQPRQRRHSRTAGGVGGGMRKRPLIVGIFVAALAAGCAGGASVQTMPDDPAGIDLGELWVEPRDLASRDLFYGAGGLAQAPGSSATYQIVAVDRTGFSPGYDVRDARGGDWSVKLGVEAQPEVVVSRVLWALGYHQPPTY